MQDLKLALSMIIEEHEPAEIIKRGLGTIEQYVDGIFITITYKETQPEDSELISFLRSKSNIHLTFFKWTHRFDDARNFAAQQIPKDFLFYVWMDADDVWNKAELLPQIVKEAYLYNHAAVFFDYLYLVELDEQMNVREILVQHKRERVIRNDDTFKWVGKLHETLIEQKQQNVVKVFRPEVLVVHLTNNERSTANLDRNISILEEAVKQEVRKDPRTIMYLAKAYFDKAKMEPDEQQRLIRYQLCEQLFTEYLDGSGTPGVDYQAGSGWSEERSSAWEYLADIYRTHGALHRAIKSTANALIEAPQFPNYYLDMAMNYVLTKEWDKAELWLNIAKNIPIPNTTLILTPRDLKARALEIDYQIAMAKNDLDRAVAASKKMVEVFPGMKDFLDRQVQVEGLQTLNKTAQSLAFVTRFLEENNQQDKIVPLLQAVPKELQQEQFVAQMRHKFMPPRLWGNDEIAIVCGPGFEKWSPKAADARGIGGSEAAVIFNAKELAKLGYKVTVYGDPQDEAGEYDGVTYKQWFDLNIKDTYNILILWRAIGFVDNQFQARQTYLWMHDVPNNADFTKDRLDKINKVFVLSEYHKSLFRMFEAGEFITIPEDKFFVTRNGITMFDLDPTIKRDPYRMMYSSSYDRGLAHLLVVWDKVKEQVPEANLHIFYGWNTYDAIAGDNPERKVWKAQMEEMMKKDGITHHGRVSHEELAKEYMKTGIFSYPCDFQEISCQNAMTAQLYGAVPVTTDYSALKETVQFGHKMDIDVTSQEGKDIYVTQLVSALKDLAWQEGQREPMMNWARKTFTWSEVAESWKKLFDEQKGNEVSLI